LPIATSVRLNPQSRVLLFDIEHARKAFPRVLVPACKVVGEAPFEGSGLSFLALGPDQTEAVIRIGLSSAPRRVTVNDQPLVAASRTWDAESQTMLVRFPNKAVGQRVVIE
jgi:hypothetical protein